jgi:hypothetical protein
MEKTFTQINKLKFIHLALTLFLGILISKGQSTNPAPYCFPNAGSMGTGTCTGAGGNPYGFNLNSFTLGTVNVDQTGICYGTNAQAVYRYWNAPSQLITLVPGANYSVTIRSAQGIAGTYNVSRGFWIDYNKNNTFDAGELLGSAMTLNNVVGGPSSTFNFTVPCNAASGITRLRIRSQYNNLIVGTDACNVSSSYGESWDFDVNITSSNSPNADFVLPTNVWVKSVFTLFNTNPTGYINHGWDINNDGSFEQTGLQPNFTTAGGPAGTFTTPGQKCVRLESTNCLGTDTVVKCFMVNAPTTVPDVDFVASSTVIEQYQTIRLYDLTENGPYQWDWYVYDSTTYASQDYYPELDDYDAIVDDPNNIGLTRYTKNPEFQFYLPGKYTITLRARNDEGWSDEVRKVMYITVVLPTEFILGFGAYGPNGDNVVESPTGTIYDNGGKFLNYGNNQGLGSRSFVRITPCNAERIDLTMTQLKFKDGGDRLRVWDGKSPGGPGTTLLANWTTGASVPRTVSAFSGSMYVLFESDGGGVDSGFAGYYSSKLGPATITPPDFEANSTPSYVLAPVKFTNTSPNVVGVPTWEWRIDDVLVSTKQDYNHVFTYDNDFEVCLTVKSCVGDATTCKTISVVSPSGPSEIDVWASNRRPVINQDLVSLKPIVTGANRFEWTVFPINYTLMNPPTVSNGSFGPGFVNYINTPGDSIPTPILKFPNAGCYTITLKAWNSMLPTTTVSSIVKNIFICAVDYCEPTSYIVTQDMGINSVKISDGANIVLENESESGITAYSDYTKSDIAHLTFGKTYEIEIYRISNVDPANRKAWIDWNVDGDFTDVGEEILFEPSSRANFYRGTFKVPELSKSYEGSTRLRVATNYQNENTTPCGPLVAGEYEDYGIVLFNDNSAPIISLLGQDTVRIELGSSYTDAGATAYDPSEGDITSRIVVTSDLELGGSGIYTYEYNVTDFSGNKAATVKRIVYVIYDMTPPVLTLNPGSTACIEANKNNPPYVDPGATATDNRAPFNLNPLIQVSGMVNTRAIGNYTLTYSVQDVAGHSVSLTRSVCVEDTKVPTIISNGDTSIQINTIWIDNTFATDAYDNNPTLVKTWGINGAVKTWQKGTYPITYTAFDQSGNQAVPVTRRYRVDDFIAPTIELNTFDIVYHDVRTPYVSVEPSVTDNFYPPSQLSYIRTSSNVNENVLGTYAEEFKATDPSGNTTTKTRTVVVQDNIAPIIWGDVINGCVGESVWPMWGLSISDNYYTPADLKPLVLLLNQNINQWEEGLYYATYRVTDPSGNTSEDFTRLIKYTYWPKCINSTVGVDDVKTKETVNVYPNPSNGIVNIDLNGALTQNATIEVYNAMGQKVLSQSFTNAIGKFEIDLGTFAKGVYNIQLKADGQIVSKRVVLQ